jgi:hypothetical protein
MQMKHLQTKEQSEMKKSVTMRICERKMTETIKKFEMTKRIENMKS